ncbi:MAG TPA: acetyl-CoA C-acyltransferase [Chitinophagales bacterium]|jgi:acetyl-CoA C-acetyltransferase|nr:acetyl-CoA C-acyltransferase [Chitinophagales bacterium]HQO88713.1 acetyl-CoA C-acyltransferase [Chitinophagales bacterium]
MQEVYIVSVARTPIGSLGGVLSGVTAVELGKIAVQAAMERAGVNGTQIDEVYMGNVLQANVGQAPAQQVSIAAGIATTTPCTTVNKVCASGMKAIMLGAQSIMLGDNQVVVVGGMESMSNAPHYLPSGRTGIRYGNGEILDAIVRDGLQDPYKKYMMGNAGEVCAKHYSFSREDQDNYAIASYKRAQEAYANGYFKDEIVPVVIASRKGDVTIAEDEEYKKFDESKVGALKPAFEKEGTITAINASKINDGASAMVLMSGDKVKELGVQPLAKIIGFADASQEPEWFTTTPSKAIPKALDKAGLKVEDVDFFEVNEAFSVVALANMKEMNIAHDKINVFGGAVALGHPIGNSGCRIVGTLISILKHKGGKIGAAGICNGGGGASAMVIEKV